MMTSDGLQLQFGDLLSFQNIDKFHLFLEGRHQFISLLLKLLIFRDKSLHMPSIRSTGVLRYHSNTTSCVQC